MSKGISKLQRMIVGLLDGTVKRQCYSGHELTTSELLSELVESGLMSEDGSRKTAMFTVRRACFSLANRGLLQYSYEIDFNNPGARTASWRVKVDSPELARDVQPGIAISGRVDTLPVRRTDALE